MTIEGILLLIGLAISFIAGTYLAIQERNQKSFAIKQANEHSARIQSKVQKRRDK